MNTPYVKQYDEKGLLINPIKGKYVNEFPNRSTRRKEVGINNKGNHNPRKRALLIVGRNVKGWLWVQRILQPNGKVKKVTHYTDAVYF